MAAREQQGECVRAGKFTDRGQSDVSAALQTLASVEGMRVHGSGTALKWDENSYLILFHTKDALDRYVTLAYLMQAHPPFAVTNVSRPLPLQGVRRPLPMRSTKSPGRW